MSATVRFAFAIRFKFPHFISSPFVLWFRVFELRLGVGADQPRQRHLRGTGVVRLADLCATGFRCLGFAFGYPVYTDPCLISRPPFKAVSRPLELALDRPLTDVREFLNRAGPAVSRDQDAAMRRPASRYRLPGGNHRRHRPTTVTVSPPPDLRARRHRCQLVTGRSSNISAAALYLREHLLHVPPVQHDAFFNMGL